ncbi:MAG TPA: DUF6265 family protein [Pirellulaceae bacterium]|nr:DUF6265 family protein [Pirellulaceae bacterium]
MSVSSVIRFARTSTILLAALLSVPSVSPSSAAADEPVSQTENTLRLADGASSPPESIEAMRWLAGRWVGEGLGGEVEEIWAEPQDGQMMGMFRFVSEGKVVFYELMTLVEDQGSLKLRVKHFGKDFVGWEEKSDSVEFRWVGQSDGRIDFEGLSFRPDPDGERLTIHLAMKSAGKIEEGNFRFRRAPLGATAK